MALRLPDLPWLDEAHVRRGALRDQGLLRNIRPKGLLLAAPRRTFVAAGARRLPSDRFQIAGAPFDARALLLRRKVLALSTGIVLERVAVVPVAAELALPGLSILVGDSRLMCNGAQLALGLFLATDRQLEAELRGLRLNVFQLENLLD